MGYCMTQREVSFFIAKENKEKAFEAIKKLANMAKEWGGGSSSCGGKITRHFSWVDTDVLLATTNFQQAMAEWRYEVEEDSDGNIDNISFTGEKLGDDMFLFESIAPYVKKGSFIDMEGEDGYIWRWYFDGKKVVEQTGRVVFE